MATNQEFLRFLRSEDADPVSVRTWLERNNFDINADFGDGRTALHWAAYRGEGRVVGILLEAGAKVEGLTAEGLEQNQPTALSGAIVNSNTPIALLLLHYGANPNMPNQYGTTAFHQAADEGNVVVVNAALTAQPMIVDLTLTNHTGRTALEMAGDELHTEVVGAINNYMNGVITTGVEGLDISG